MNSPNHSPTGLQNGPRQIRATVHTPYLQIWFRRFYDAEKPDQDLKVDPSDINYPSELRCPNCDRISADSICDCGAAIQHPNIGELP